MDREAFILTLIMMGLTEDPNYRNNETGYICYIGPSFTIDIPNYKSKGACIFIPEDMDDTGEGASLVNIEGLQLFTFEQILKFIEMMHDT